MSEGQDQNLVVTVLYVPRSLDSGTKKKTIKEQKQKKKKKKKKKKNKQ